MTAAMSVPVQHEGPSPDLWLDLLRRVDDDSPRAFVWKNADPALEGHGDIDMMAPRYEWDRIAVTFSHWARDHGLGPAVACTHVPGNLFLVAPDPVTPVLYELDVRDRVSFRGATVLTAEAPERLIVDDPRGFRKVAPGAEGVIKLVLHGIGRAGKQKPRGLAKENVRELLAERDPGAADLFGSTRGAVSSLAARASQGGWSRGSAAVVELRSTVAGAFAPSGLITGLKRKKAKTSCPVLEAIVKNDRRIPGDRDGWLRRVAETHRDTVGEGLGR